MLYHRLIELTIVFVILLIITTIVVLPNQVTYFSLFGNAHNS